MSEVQKQEAISGSKVQFEQAKAQIDYQKLMQEAALKKELMQLEFQMNMQLKGMEVDGKKTATLHQTVVFTRLPTRE